MPYVLDANVMIEAKRRHYGLDFCPAFWDWLGVAHAKGALHSIEKVEDELREGKDELTTWATGCDAGFFVKPDDPMIKALSKVSAWLNSTNYTPSAKAEFLSAADYYLIGHALAHNHTVVTHELPEPNRMGKVKIPDACIAVGVKWTTPFKMLRAEKAHFKLGP